MTCPLCRVAVPRARFWGFLALIGVAAIISWYLVVGAH